jgi:hypothetical protein
VDGLLLVVVQVDIEHQQDLLVVALVLKQRLH